MRYGLWIEDPERYTGWFGLAAGDKFSPWAFASKDEADGKAAAYLSNRPSASVEVKPDPPEELPWNEGEWRKA